MLLQASIPNTAAIYLSIERTNCVKEKIMPFYGGRQGAERLIMRPENVNDYCKDLLSTYVQPKAEPVTEAQCVEFAKQFYDKYPI